MSDFILYGLAGIGTFCVVFGWGAVLIAARDQRRQDRLADQLARLRFSEISPADQRWAEKQWPVNFDRARRMAETAQEPKP